MTATEDRTPLDVRQVKVDPRWALRVPPSLALRKLVLPLCELEGEVTVACADPDDAATLKALERLVGRPLKVRRADPEALRAVLRRVYGESPTADAPRPASPSSTVRRRPTGEASPASDPEDPVALANELLYAAWLRQASDVHVDPGRDGVRVRLRVDGQLEDYRTLPGRVHTELLSRIKVLAGMDIAEKRAPQDARFTHDLGPGQKLEIRVATLPTKHGERAALRLLAVDAETLTLEHLGTSPRDLALLEAAAQRPHGLILATGPTGCGKTTTLYAALRRIIASRPVNAISVQDPIEYDIPGVAQVEVDSAQKVTFAKALRSILRHDPDVILIGEIRDLETVDTAIKAALTGHLVLATLHTNSAASSVTRLADTGVDRYLIAATLSLVVAQRLARRLCPACRQGVRLDAAQARALGAPEAEGLEAFAPRGCVYCAGRGYAGRVGLFELLVVDEDLSRAIAGGASEGELVALTRAKKAPTIRDDALAKLGQGVVSLSDVLAAVAL